MQEKRYNFGPVQMPTVSAFLFIAVNGPSSSMRGFFHKFA